MDKMLSGCAITERAAKVSTEKIVEEEGCFSVDTTLPPSGQYWEYVPAAQTILLQEYEDLYEAFLEEAGRNAEINVLRVDYYEAAEIDGATGVNAFFSITIPLLSPTIFFVLVTRVIGSLQVFDLIYMVIDKSNPALTKTQSLVYLFYKYAFINKNMGYGATIVVVLLIITMILTVFQMIGQKKWVFYN